MIVFSDSLNVELCVKYMAEAENASFDSAFGVGTYLTSKPLAHLWLHCLGVVPSSRANLCSDDFINSSTGKKSVPLNIVIKLSSAAGRPAVKISDSTGKNTGDPTVVDGVKQALGYVEKDWEGGNEATRWGTADSLGSSSSLDLGM